MSESSAFKGIIYPGEVDLLASAFNRLCRAAQIDRNSETANDLATLVITEFQAGSRCDQQLLHAVACSAIYRNAITRSAQSLSRSQMRRLARRDPS